MSSEETNQPDLQATESENAQAASDAVENQNDVKDDVKSESAATDDAVKNDAEVSATDDAVKADAEASATDDTAKANAEAPATVSDAIKTGLKETIDTFKAFVHAPREIIGINIINIFEGMAYFGILTLLMLFLTKNVELNDVHASWVVSGYLMLITLSQLFLGGLSDRVGPKRMFGISIAVLLVSRFILGFAEPALSTQFGTGLWSPFFFAIVVALLMAALSYGVFNPAVYSLTRMYSDKKTSAVSYAMLYAGMNLGAFLIGLALPSIRRGFADSTDEAGNVIPSIIPGTNGNGYSGALIFIAGIMIIVMLLYVFFLLRSKNKPLCDPKEADPDEPQDAKPDHKLTLKERLKRHPLADPKFDFFIFILIPVQTLFAYQNILIPTYLERCFREFPTISDNFETFSNINPLIVFICAPVIAALTAKQDVYKMMIIGTTVMALPTFLLCLGQTPTLFLTFILIGAIGESMWQPRFLQHVTQIAPKERMGAYVGIANLPWFMTKFIVGIYVGFFMRKYIPDPDTLSAGMSQDPQTMWFIFALIAITSPIALYLARNWCNAKKPEDAKSDASDTEAKADNDADDNAKLENDEEFEDITSAKSKETEQA